MITSNITYMATPKTSFTITYYESRWWWWKDRECVRHVRAGKHVSVYMCKDDLGGYGYVLTDLQDVWLAEGMFHDVNK